MARLSTDQVLKDKQSRDPNSITSLSLTHKALSDVSCLSDFKNLERLDLGFNNLTSLEGLKSCVNLKWLSVVQNKLQSLKGIEGLSKLTVLNAGKNKLRSMNEVMSLVSLRALILNDNDIISICKLDQMKDLNTLVLSRNPIREIGKSLFKVKFITKLSLSNCQLQIIGSSLKSCTELKELRLAHNDIRTLPAELAYNKKLQNLDLGNNLITRKLEIKVLNSLVNLKNLNLQGNPIAENDKLANKVRKLLPNLHIFNARPMDKNTKKEKGDAIEKARDSSNSADNKIKAGKEEKRDHNRETNDKLSKKEIQHNKNESAEKKKLKKKAKEKEGELDGIDDKKYSGGPVTGQDKDVHLNDTKDVDSEKDLKRKRKKTSEQLSNKDVPIDNDDKRAEKKQKKKSKEKQGELNVIDNGEMSFSELFSANIPENPILGIDNNKVDKAFQLNSVDGLVTFSAKRKKTKNRDKGHTLQLSEEIEIGLGGPSTWSDERLFCEGAA